MGKLVELKANVAKWFGKISANCKEPLSVGKAGYLIPAQGEGGWCYYQLCLVEPPGMEPAGWP